MTRESIDVASGGSRLMSEEDLSAGFANLQQHQGKDAKCVNSIAESVHWNSGLLNALVNRVNTIEGADKLMTEEINKHGLSICQLTEDLKTVLDLVHQKDRKHETSLRKDFSAMAVTLEEGHTALNENIEAVSRASAAASRAMTGDQGQGARGPDVSEISEKVAILSKHAEQAIDRFVAIENQMRHAVTDAAAIKAELIGSRSEVSSEMAAIRAEISQIV